MAKTPNYQLEGPALMPASGGKPQELVILLHGLGADGLDLLGIGEALNECLPHARFVAPNAPFPCDMAPFGFQWFSLRDLSPQSLWDGVSQAEPKLQMFIDHELKRSGLSDDRLILIGFSQGAMMALHTALRRPKPCAAVIGFSGALIGEEHLSDARVVSKPPICLVHGEEDPVVPFAALGAAEAALARHGCDVEAHPRPGLGHAIEPGGVDIAWQFISRHLPPAQA